MAESGSLRTPRHVAIIMDGNGRWAKKRLLPRLAGHRQGAEAVRRTVRACIDRGISYLTIYAFSSENWKRPADEVDDLMGLLRHYLRNEIAELHRNGVRVRFIGDTASLAPDLRALVDEARTGTADNTALTLVIALNYGGQAELVRAVRSVAADVAAGRLSIEAIDETCLSGHLDTAGMPDPDLVIRTSGEQRLSNFMLWQAAYAELVFLECLWPDFNEATLDEALEEFAARERRFGGR
ncbi:MAG: isoprenyl transferase [Sphingomonadales bacterium]|nr:MAG: isoprenyl transferase [Sphingomonadales bacterium]